MALVTVECVLGVAVEQLRLPGLLRPQREFRKLTTSFMFVPCTKCMKQTHNYRPVQMFDIQNERTYSSEIVYWKPALNVSNELTPSFYYLIG